MPETDMGRVGYEGLSGLPCWEPLLEGGITSIHSSYHFEVFTFGQGLPFQGSFCSVINFGSGLGPLSEPLTDELEGKLRVPLGDTFVRRPKFISSAWVVLNLFEAGCRKEAALGVVQEEVPEDLTSSTLAQTFPGELFNGWIPFVKSGY